MSHSRNYAMKLEDTSRPNPPIAASLLEAPPALHPPTLTSHDGHRPRHAVERVCTQVRGAADT